MRGKPISEVSRVAYDNSGPAFPTPETTNYSNRGITKRDYFAGLAMQALVARGAEGDAARYLSAAGAAVTDEYIARKAYLIADAMIDAR